ncbi:MAG: nuclear transport factor 2 family protein [Moraxellaceae bacterium]|jgi:ketosteroid isomerase-like protein|nr:nuclear transport factor 2 family protein [Moraxellaceae bacterium]
MMQHLTNSTARAFALEWVAAWNAHDIERVLSHYAEDVAFHSPFIAIFAEEASGHLLGKAALRTYWAAALENLPDLRFELLDVLLGAGSLTVYYRGHRGKVAETFFFSEDGKVQRATACYSVGLVDTAGE